MSYPVRVISDGDTAWGGDIRFVVAGVNDHQTRLVALEAGATAVTANTQTGTTYTLALTDAGLVVERNNAAANTTTVPPNSSVAFPIGTVLEVAQIGAGASTIVAGAGVTIRTPSTLVLRTQYSTVALRKRATNEWVLSGDVA